MAGTMTHGIRTDLGLEMLQITCMIRLVWMAWLSMAQLPSISFWTCQVVVATLPVVVISTSRIPASELPMMKVRRRNSMKLGRRSERTRWCRSGWRRRRRTGSASPMSGLGSPLPRYQSPPPAELSSTQQNMAEMDGRTRS